MSVLRPSELPASFNSDPCVSSLVFYMPLGSEVQIIQTIQTIQIIQHVIIAAIGRYYLPSSFSAITCRYLPLCTAILSGLSSR